MEELLDLARVQVLAAPDDHILDPADDPAIARLVQRREITGVHPAGGIDDLASPQIVPPIADHDGIAPGAKLARLAPLHHPSPIIDDLRFQVGHDPSHGRDAKRRRVVAPRLETDRARLRHAIGDRHRAHVHFRDHALHHFGRTRRTCHDAAA